MFGSKRSIHTFGVRFRTFALARSTLPCNFLRSTTAAALVEKKLRARRRVWPLRTRAAGHVSRAACAAQNIRLEPVILRHQDQLASRPLQTTRLPIAERRCQ